MATTKSTQGASAPSSAEIHTQQSIALELSEDDFLHLRALLEGACAGLSGSTDNDVSRASLRGALDFLRDREAGIGAPERRAGEINHTDRMLPAQEYIAWLRDIERSSGIADDVRAYLVHRDQDGVRRMKAVDNDESVLKIDRDLMKHLSDPGAFNAVFFQKLLEFCLERLRELDAPVGLNNMPGEYGARGEIARRAAIAIDDMVELLQRLNGSDWDGAGPRVLLAQIRNSAGAIMSAVDDDATVEELLEQAGLEAARE